MMKKTETTMKHDEKERKTMQNDENERKNNAK